MSAPRPPSADSSPVENRTGGAGVASGKPPNSSALAGREHELARIDALLGEASAGRSGALLVVGEPGVGKTTLLEAARARADSFTCLGTAASRPSRTWRTPGCSVCSTRSGTGWRTFRDTRRPRSGRRWPGRAVRRPPTRSSWVPPPSRSSPRPPSTGRCWCSWTTCSGWTRSPRRRSPSRRADSVRTPSRSCWRPGRARSRPELGQGLPVLPVGGLSASAAAMLMPTRAAPGVVDRLVAATQGNPLALVEVAARLDDAQWLGAAGLPDPLPAGDRLREHFGPRSPSSLRRLARRAVPGSGR